MQALYPKHYPLRSSTALRSSQTIGCAVPHRNKSAPSGKELEIALLELLRKNHFSGPEEASVFAVGPKPTPVYIVTMGSDVAQVLETLLAPILGKRTQPSSTEWILFRADAEAILKAAA
jgi:hypothetical protein